MKLPKRFALSTLLLLMLVVALVFGYAQWRRQWLLAEIRQLNALSTRVAPGLWFEPIRTLPELQVRDGLWPTVMAPSLPIPICFVRSDNNSYLLPGDKMEYGINELRARLTELQRRLIAVGLSEVEFRQYGDGSNRLGSSVASDVNAIGE